MSAPRLSCKPAGGSVWYRRNFTCTSGATRERCMPWHHKQHASSKPCRSPATCGCRKDDAHKQRWRAATELCS